MNNRQRKTQYAIRNTQYAKRGFTLIELVVAIGLLSIVLVFSGVVFQKSIGSFRTASAQAEIMRKLRVITEQLDSDFEGLQKDGFLILRSEIMPNRVEYQGAPLGNFRADRLYYFCTGDFYSWSNPFVRSNIARIYLGHEGLSILDPNVSVNQWKLIRDTLLLTPGYTVIDSNGISYAGCKADSPTILSDAYSILNNPPGVDITADVSSVRRLLCENAGLMAVEWSDGLDPNGVIAWFGLGNNRGNILIEPIDPPSTVLYIAQWIPSTLPAMWPRALKFTFTLYDSKGIFKNGQTFTHIVYLGD